MRRDLVAAGSAGCEVKSFLDPTQMVDPKKVNSLAADGTATPIVQPILRDLDLGVGRPAGAFPEARDVAAQRPGGRVTTDYVLGPSDQIRLTIRNFFGNDADPSSTSSRSATRG